MRLDKLASTGAQAFIAASNPVALSKAVTETATTVIAIASAAALFIYSVYEHFEAKKHAKEIATIESIHQAYLAKISIHECSIVVGFPPIFQKNPDGTYQAMSMTDAEVHSIAKNALRSPTDVDLVLYRNHIISAIASLKKYYFLHDDKTGITVQVILYLINILEKLLQFEGYAFDIAYLNALCDFICNYASTKGEKSEHFTCLNPVFRHLQYATQKLMHHKETRSQEEMISELRGTCLFYINQSICALTKFLTPYTEWNLVNYSDPYLLRKGIYAEEYITRIAGPIRWTHEQKNLPEHCSLTNLIQILSRYYLQAIDSTRRPSIPQQSELIINSLPEDVLENIHQIFEAHPDQNPAKPINHKDTREIINALVQFSKLIHSIISLLYFLNELTKMIKNLGTAETDNPAHCKKIYALHEILSDYIETQAESLQKSLIKINKKNDNQMRIAEKECFLRELIEMISEIKINIDTQSTNIRERRKAFYQKQKTTTHTETPHEHMSDVVTQIEIACNLTTPNIANNSIAITNSAEQRQQPLPAIPTVRMQPTMQPIQIIRRPPPPVPSAPTRNTAATCISNNVQRNIETTIFPKTYYAMYEAAKTKSSYKNLQILYLMLVLMKDYTKNNSRVSRILHGSFWHHHVEKAAKFSENLQEKLSAIRVNSDDATHALLTEQLGILSNIAKDKSTNQNGSFARRFNFITQNCRAQQIPLETQTPRAA